MPDSGTPLRHGARTAAGRAGLWFGLLGPLEARRGEQVCTPTAPMQRAVLGLLLLHGNEVLPASRIIDALWSGKPPRSAGAAVQMYIAGIRRALGLTPAVVLRTMPSGYLLQLAQDQVDLGQFRVLAKQARRERGAGRCARAGALFRRALALWRGPALAGLDWAHVFEPYVVRLEEERVALLQERISVDLCQGRGLEVVAELRELCTRYPLVESLHQLLMLALHRTGRTADALGVYTRIWHAMREEVGVEPGPALQAAHRAILRDCSHLPAFRHGQEADRRGGSRVCDPQIFAGWD